MRRRRSVLGCCGAVLASLAGCAGIASVGYSGDEEPPDTASRAGDSPGAGAARPGALGEDELPVPRSKLVRGAARDAIPAIDEPAFGADWSGITMDAVTRHGMEYTSRLRLEADDAVIGVTRGDAARAYPLRILTVHEVVNDAFAPTGWRGHEGRERRSDGPLLVTYCPLCGSAMTAVRTVRGEETTFGVSGLLYRSDLVMYDEATESLWSQIAATAIRGPAVGRVLELVPSTLTTWGEWQAAHPDTVVLRPPPDSGTVTDTVARNYDFSPYEGYRTSERIGLAGSYDDDRLHPKTTVVGVADGGTAVAYPLPVAREAGVVNDTVGDLPVVVAATDEGTLVAYSRRVEGETLTFERADADHLRAGGSRWRLTTGTAVDGPHEGTTLTQANETSPMFFFAWQDFNGETTVYGAEGGDATGTPSGE